MPALPFLSLAALLLQFSAAAGPCRLPSGEPATRRVRLSSSGVDLQIPASWSESVEEHLSVSRVQDDRDRACRLVLTRHEGSDAATRIRRVHERLYLARSLIEGTCGEERIRRLSKRGRAVFGEYDRDGRSRVYAMFWSTGREGYAALLTCPRGTPGDWRVALPLLSSIRRTAP